jgi:hypothetical protein
MFKAGNLCHKDAIFLLTIKIPLALQYELSFVQPMRDQHIRGTMLKELQHKNM